MKVFISQPMADKTNEEIKTERENAIKNISTSFETEDIEIIDSFFEGAPHDVKPLWFLGKSIQLLSDADVIYMCRNWEQYRGCRLEWNCAMQYGIEVIEEYDFDGDK